MEGADSARAKIMRVVELLRRDLASHWFNSCSTEFHNYIAFAFALRIQGNLTEQGKPISTRSKETKPTRILVLKLLSSSFESKCCWLDGKWAGEQLTLSQIFTDHLSCSINFFILEYDYTAAKQSDHSQSSRPQSYFSPGLGVSSRVGYDWLIAPTLFCCTQSVVIFWYCVVCSSKHYSQRCSDLH